ncbi:MAG: eukaryotic-like serine/threonine-protein kinase [Blastococcus sp.]|nr:eukaryotic-like serine/threonine-protein kinase [Blastococcus sp.]
MEGNPLPVTTDLDDGRAVWDPAPGMPLVPGYLAWAPIAVGDRRETWLTWSVQLWTPAVVKIVRPRWSPGSTVALGREVRALRGRTHPAFPRLLDDGRRSPIPYLAVEYLDGTALDESVEKDGPLSANETARMGVLLFGALRALHATGTAHMDISPYNVLLVDRKTRLVDLGAARKLGSRLRRGEPVGTDGFAAPEVLAGRGGAVTAGMDVHGVGATLRSVLDTDSAGAGRVAEVLDWLTDPDPDCRPTPDIAMTALVRYAGAGPARPWPRWADRELPRPPRRRRTPTPVAAAPLTRAV